MQEAEAKANRLAGEKSPYLIQHARNPVGWFPWGAEAFDKARRENKPVFLSVGYSTCHWCHVMERESFMDPEIARILNAGFVPIKVDREERPDVDRMYMAYVQATTGGGGWPMSVWLTPELRPFYGGTYFPPEDGRGRPGFRHLLTHIAALWADRRDQIHGQSERMMDALAAHARTEDSVRMPPAAELRSRALGQMRAGFDSENGGFGGAPKFPRPAATELLFDIHATSADPAERADALRMALETLRGIAAGGIHDLIGGGFHRYTVDAAWRVPHFEKMLYDQAQLASAYVTASQFSAEPVFGAAARGALAYVQREMTDPEGGFYCAEDADSGRPENPSEHGEGAYYVWTETELEAVLGPESAALFAFAGGVRPEGNVEEDPLGEFGGRNILYCAHSAEACATALGLAPGAVRSALEAASLRLLEARGTRPRPFRDDKVISAWNGLMISAFSRAAQVFGDSTYAHSAHRAASFLRDRLVDPATGRLARSFRGGVRDDRGFAEDYAFVIQGLLDLYETSFDVRWIEWAVQLQEKQDELFWDPAGGGYFENAGDDPSVLLRLKEENDSAEPSSNSVSVRNLARLAAMLGRGDWRTRAERAAAAFARQLGRAPTAMPQMIASMGWLGASPMQIVVLGEPGSECAAGMVAEVWKRFLPRRVLIRVDSRSRGFFGDRIPFVAGLPDATAAAYVCENFTCRLPVGDAAGLAAQLQAGGGGPPQPHRDGD
jgi:uncharacterized protein YyaL (SSP411 family)